MIIEAKQRTDGYMNAVQVLEVIEELSHSQGFYSRLYSNILYLKENDEVSFNKWCEEIESLNFKEPIDVVLYLEC